MIGLKAPLNALLPTAGRFVMIAVILPLVIDLLQTRIESVGIPLQPVAFRWTAFFILGALTAIATFLSSASVEGSRPWLVGKLAGGVVGLMVLTYLSGPILGSSPGEAEFAIPLQESSNIVHVQAQPLLYLTYGLILIGLVSSASKYLGHTNRSKVSTSEEGVQESSPNSS